MDEQQRRRTMLGWFEYLDDAKRELTLSEFMAMMLFHIRQHVATMNERTESVKQAAEHVEGMLGSLDDTMAETNETYRRISTSRGRPSAPALDARNHSRRDADGDA